MNGGMGIRWKRTAEALIRLAEDQKGKPEGNVARQKLQQILSKYPETRSHPPVIAFIERDLGMAPPGSEAPRVSYGTMPMSEFYRMRQAGVNTDGRWTGTSFQDAVRKMQDDLRQRISDRMGRIILETMERQFMQGGRDIRFHMGRSFVNDETSNE